MPHQLHISVNLALDLYSHIDRPLFTVQSIFPSTFFLIAYPFSIRNTVSFSLIVLASVTSVIPGPLTLLHRLFVRSSTMSSRKEKSATLYMWMSSGSEAMVLSSFSSAFFTPGDQNHKRHVKAQIHSLSIVFQ